MSRVVIATSTFYKDAHDIRAKMALRFADLADKSSWPMVVMDAGSPQEFLDAMKSCGAHMISVFSTMKMGACRREALRYAMMLVEDEGVVIWAEPEKYPLIGDISKIATPILDNLADLVIPERSMEGIQSYPPEQAAAEMIGNLAFEYLTGQPFDVWFGPFAANRKALQYFLDYQGEYGDLWDSIIIPRVTAIKAGVRVTGVLVDYLHPSEQTKQEAGNVDFLLKRIDQLKNLVPALQKEAAKNAVVAAR